MKEILATDGTPILVDDEDYPVLSRRKWYTLNVSDQCIYAMTPMRLGKYWSKIAMHRLIMNPPGRKEVDHRDGNGLNNQKQNLRICTHRENIQAKRKPRRGSPENNPYKGVSRKPHGVWVAKICNRGKQTYLGTFFSPESAALAYNEAASRFFGKFARLNKIEGIKS